MELIQNRKHQRADLQPLRALPAAPVGVLEASARLIASSVHCNFNFIA